MNRFKSDEKFLYTAFFIIFFLIFQPSLFCDEIKSKKEDNNNLNKLYDEYKTLSDKLIGFQKSVVEKNEEIRKQRDDLQKLIKNKWENISKKSQVDIEKIKTLKSKLFVKNIDEKQKKILMSQYHKEVMKLQQARNLTYNDKEILEKRKSFSDMLKKLTIKIYPQTQKLYSKLDSLRSDIKKLGK